MISRYRRGCRIVIATHKRHYRDTRSFKVTPPRFFQARRSFIRVRLHLNALFGVAHISNAVRATSVLSNFEKACTDNSTWDVPHPRAPAPLQPHSYRPPDAKRRPASPPSVRSCAREYPGSRYEICKHDVRPTTIFQYLNGRLIFKQA